MPDNHYEHQKRTLYDPTGAVIWASDAVSGVQYPRFKLAWGVDGSAADASASSPLPVTDATVALAIGAKDSTLPADGIAILINDSGTSRVPGADRTVGGFTAIAISGAVAHDAADELKPVKIGAKATTALSGLTLVADADRTNLFAGVDGVLIVRPHCNLEDIVSGNATNTDGSSTSCISAQGSGIKTCLMAVTLANSSATNITVDIKDGSTAKWTFPVPANGGVTHPFPVPLVGTANTAWNFDASAGVTTLTCSMLGFKSKV